MKIADLEETAALAHLNLDKGELAGAFPAFEQMLGFFAAMQGADEDTGAFAVPLARLADDAPAVSSGHFRPDRDLNNAHTTASIGLNQGAVVQETPVSETSVSGLLDNAGERDGRFIVVPNVL
jgi:aspartyl-tRNA(Asn)/glutamyl-tRNA(Gln) amidotransferase subunit C